MLRLEKYLIISRNARWSRKRGGSLPASPPNRSSISNSLSCKVKMRTVVLGSRTMGERQSPRPRGEARCGAARLLAPSHERHMGHGGSTGVDSKVADTSLDGSQQTPFAFDTLTNGERVV